MLMETLDQGAIFLATIWGGMVIGIIYDAFCILRAVLRAKDGLTAMMDVLFWLITTAVILFVLFTANDGEVRLYHVVGFLVGIGIYRISISRLVMGIFCICMQAIIKILHTKPIRFIRSKFVR